MFAEGNGVFSEAEWQGLTKTLSMSHRQEQIAHCVLQDMSDKQIARQLEIALPTVRTHMGRLFEKLHVEDRTGLVLRIVSEFRAECRAIGCPRN